MNEYKQEYLSKDLSKEENLLKEALQGAFGAIKNCEIVKKQYNFKGRVIYLSILALLSSIIYGVFMFCTSWVRIEIRYVLMVLETLLHLFFLLRFGFGFWVDIKSRKFAERIKFVRGADGKKYYFAEGTYTKKFEYEGGKLAFWGQDNYDKFTDKTTLSPFASRFDRNLQRRSSNYTVLDADFLFEKIIKGSFAVSDTAIKSISEEMSFSIKLENGMIKSLFYVGKADMFYDSTSPLHVFDTKLPFEYSISYVFEKINAPNPQIFLPSLARKAMKDFLMKLPDEKYVKIDLDEIDKLQVVQAEIVKKK